MPAHLSRLCLPAALLGLLVASAPRAAPNPQSVTPDARSASPDPRSAALDPRSLEAREQFLLTAGIESVGPIGKGLTHTQKAILNDGHLTHAAQIQTVDIHMDLFRGRDGTQEPDFNDCWKFNVAAYRLAKLLHIAYMTPVSVVRSYQGKPAAFTWWIDDVAMDERQRLQQGIQPPDRGRWEAQVDIVRLFDQLIYNMDRSQENLLITSDWDVWMIDHTRAFRKWLTLRNAAAVTRCNPDLLHWLTALRREDLERQLGDLITAEEIDGLMARRDLILEKLAGQP